MVNSKPYYPEITCLKGIAILFVIMGHSLTPVLNLDTEISPILRYIIVEPQMSMFFIASGFLFSETLDWRTFFSNLKSATKPFNVLLACTCPLLLN